MTTAFPSKQNSALEGSTDNSDTKESTNTTTEIATITNWLPVLVLPLWLVYISNQWSRSSIYYLVQFDDTATSRTAMNLDLGFDQAQYGVLASVAFTSLFAIASLVAGWTADRWDRQRLTYASALLWSLAVYGTANANSYHTVLLWRVVMGLACAFSTPTAYTLIRDRVPENKVATASAFYGTGVALGSGLASLTILFDDALGWRGALNVIGATGLVSVLVAFVVLPKDEDKTTTTTTRSTVRNSTAIGSDDNNIKNGFASVVFDVQEAFATDRAKWIFLASFLRFCSGLCIGVWSAPYFRTVFDTRTGDYALAQAAISALGASASGVLGGSIADTLSSRIGTINNNAAQDDNPVDVIGVRLWVPIVGSILAAPTWYFAMHSPESFEISMAWLAAEYFVAECWFGPTISTLQATVGSRVGGTAQGLFTLTGAVANFAPAFVGYLYGQAVGGDAGGDAGELSSLLSYTVCFCYLSSAACFYVAATCPAPISKATKIT